MSDSDPSWLREMAQAISPIVENELLRREAVGTLRRRARERSIDSEIWRQLLKLKKSADELEAAMFSNREPAERQKVIRRVFALCRAMNRREAER